MSNVGYSFDGDFGCGRLKNGMAFLFDREKYLIIDATKWYVSYQGGRPYLVDRRGRKMHSYLLECPPGNEIDHISLDTLDNRLCNLRVCTHQQNQMNQPLQRNNTSGVSGVGWYAPKNKYRARIKVGQRDVHLGYYTSFEEAVQARNVGMECMFGEFGIYNDISPAPKWIREIVIEKCKRFVSLSVCKAFLVSEDVA